MSDRKWHFDDPVPLLMPFYLNGREILRSALQTRLKADMGNRWGILNGLRKEYLVIASQNIDAGAIADQNC